LPILSDLDNLIKRYFGEKRKIAYDYNKSEDDSDPDSHSNSSSNEESNSSKSGSENETEEEEEEEDSKEEEESSKEEEEEESKEEEEEESEDEESSEEEESTTSQDKVENIRENNQTPTKNLSPKISIKAMKPLADNNSNNDDRLAKLDIIGEKKVIKRSTTSGLSREEKKLGYKTISIV
jgi:hypothetical protein